MRQFDDLKKMIQAAETEANALIDKLEEEQEDSQGEYDDWEAENEDDRGPEPDVIDNSEKVTALRECIDYLDNAERELND